MFIIFEQMFQYTSVQVLFKRAELYLFEPCYFSQKGNL